jgi:hypothetical protein
MRGDCVTTDDSYGAWREGAHDDLMLGVCLALWIAKEGEDKIAYVFAGPARGWGY